MRVLLIALVLFLPTVAHAQGIPPWLPSDANCAKYQIPDCETMVPIGAQIYVAGADGSTIILSNWTGQQVGTLTTPAVTPTPSSTPSPEFTATWTPTPIGATASVTQTASPTPSSTATPAQTAQVVAKGLESLVVNGISFRCAVVSKKHYECHA